MIWTKNNEAKTQNGSICMVIKVTRSGSVLLRSVNLYDNCVY